MKANIMDCVRKMDMISKTIIAVGGILVFICSLTACLLFVVNVKLTDFTTALYWFREILKLSGSILGVTFIPALIFEVISIRLGLKRSAD